MAIQCSLKHAQHKYLLLFQIILRVSLYYEVISFLGAPTADSMKQVSTKFRTKWRWLLNLNAPPSMANADKVASVANATRSPRFLRRIICIRMLDDLALRQSSLLFDRQGRLISMLLDEQRKFE